MEVKKGYKLTDIGVIPDDWNCSIINDILDEISMGPFGSDITVSNFVSYGIPVLSGNNIRSERLKDVFVNFVTSAKAKALKKAIARRGDIIITHRGTLGQISFIPEDSMYKLYVISQSQFRVRFTSTVNPYYIVSYFHTKKGQLALLEGKGHTGVPAIAQPTTTFRKIAVPLPPLIEQNSITEALSDADLLIGYIEKLIAKQKNIKLGSMQELLTGKKRLPGFSGKWLDKKISDIVCHDKAQG